jgi:hypothetical protein
MSKDNVVELFGKKDVAVNVSDGGAQSATNRSAILDASGQPARDAVAELDEEIIDALRAARKGLTEDGIAAVIALRREVSMCTVLEQLLLEGAIEARMHDENGPLTVDNFSFRAIKSEDTPVDEMPVDTGRAVAE